MDKIAELKKMEAEMEADALLPLRGANLVFGEGNVDCAVMFIGEAPGFNEDQQRRPFVGRGGQLLDQMMQSIGWKRPEVYITNIVKRRPPENRDPLPEEITAYRPYLTRQLDIIKPHIVVTLGRFSMNYFLPDAKITRDHGRTFNIEGTLIYPVFHPAAALRSPEMMKALAEDFKKLPKILSGDLAPENLAPAVAVSPLPPAREEKKAEEKKKQQGLF